MSDSLSQEDIDKLTKSSKQESTAKQASQLEYLNENDADVLGELANISMGSAATTLSMLLSNKVEITTPTVVEYANIEEIFKFPKDYVTVEIKYQDGLDGILIFSLESKDTAIIADLMMGSNGLVEDVQLTELQLSAVAEAMNQMMGSSSTSLASIFNFSVNITPPIVKLQKAQERLDLSDEIFGVPIIAVKFKFKVGDLIDSQMVQLMSLNQAQDQVSKFISTMTSAVDETIANINEQSSLSSNINTSMNVHSTSPMPVQPSQPLQSPITVQPVKFASFDESPQVHGESNRNLDLLLDIKLKLTVELGRTEVPIKKVLELTRGSVIELDKIAGEPVELFANGKLIAKGEVVVIEDNFGLRITSITSPDNRIKNL